MKRSYKFTQRTVLSWMRIVKWNMAQANLRALLIKIMGCVLYAVAAQVVTTTRKNIDQEKPYRSRSVHV